MIRRLVVSIPALAILLLPVAASAHVIVTPNQTTVGSEPLFNISVPNERQSPVVSLQLAIPTGVADVIPTVKEGWTIQTPTDTTATDSKITTIIWTGGVIPIGQREDFSFSAQVPANAGVLDWKAYQTYGDGTVVHWDQKPAGSDDATGNAGPYSVTKVVNDLTSDNHIATGNNINTQLPLVLSLLALLLSIGSLLFRSK